MQLIGRRTSLLSILAAAEIMTIGAPGASAAPAPIPGPLPTAAPKLEPILEERGRNYASMLSSIRAAQTAASAVSAATSKSWWVPTQSTTWQIQLGGDDINTNIKVNAIEIDADIDAAIVKKLKKKGMKVIAYFSGGSWESWRTDAGDFDKSLIGTALDGWPGENWLDIRQVGQLKTIMNARLLKAKAKGFYGADWDNVDGFTQVSGFKITAAQQLKYNKMLADITHALGMTVALKNDLRQVASLASYFDYAVNEQCSYYQECKLLAPFLKAGKAVLGIEYPGEGDDTRSYAQVKAQTDSRTYTLIKDLDLDDWGIAVRTMKSIT
ncbi:hypothetical protein ABW19_dt0202762 [Dactylella cylindrospora]|nr:hypothetical protein ABW19_dt0202762 [Dactylella cylindrospora]